MIPRWWNVTPVADALGGAAHALCAVAAGRSGCGPGGARARAGRPGHAGAARADRRCAAASRAGRRPRGCREGDAVGDVRAGARRWWIASKDGSGTFAAEIRRLAAESPEQVNYKAISRAFGTPKPTLANSYQPELLNLRTFPTLMGYSSRIMAESWESNMLYWAALGGRDPRAAIAAQRADSGVDAESGGADFRVAPGGLAGAVAVAADGGGRSAGQGAGRSLRRNARRSC